MNPLPINYPTTSIFVPPYGAVETWQKGYLKGLCTKGVGRHKDLSSPPCTLLFILSSPSIYLHWGEERVEMERGDWIIINTHETHWTEGEGVLHALFWEGHSYQEVINAANESTRSHLRENMSHLWLGTPPRWRIKAFLWETNDSLKGTSKSLSVPV